MIGTIRFAGDLSLGVAIVLLLLAAGVVAWLYLRETKQLDAPYNYLLPALRASAVALVLLILSGPVWHRRVTVGTLGRVMFAIDTSQSMSLEEAAEVAGRSPETPQSRVQRAMTLLTGDSQRKGWLESLEETHDVDVLEFSSGSPAVVWSNVDESEVPSVLDLEAVGAQTDLASVLSLQLGVAADEINSEPDGATSLNSTALVLLSDGRTNVGDSPIELAADLAQKGIAVHTVGIGLQGEPFDVGVVDVIRPESVSADGQLSGEIVLKASGLTSEKVQTPVGETNLSEKTEADQGGKTPASPSAAQQRQVTVRIESGQQTVWTQTVIPSGKQQAIPFVLDVGSILDSLQMTVPRGVQLNSQVLDLRAVIEATEDDAYADNDSMSFRVAASTRARRLLIVDGSSRWEIRYLRNLFSRDPAWSVETILFGLGTDQRELIRGDKAGEFPDNNIAMASYDAVILGEVPPEQIEEADAERLREFVRRGGGLIVLDGKYGRIRKLTETLLPELIPVRYENPQQPFEVSRIQPTNLGGQDATLSLWNNPDEQEEFWEKLPPPTLSPALQAQPGAEVLAELKGKNSEVAPWLVTRLYGGGRVYYLSTDQTWRWRYKVADRFHARFWNQLLAAAMQPPYAASDQYVAIGTDEIEYRSGQAATIRARLQAANGEPIGDAIVDALLLQDDRVVASVPMAVDDSARGTYRGVTLPLDSGQYRIRIRASGFDATALQASTPIWVGKRQVAEMSQVSLDEATLRSVSEAGAGIYLHESAADELLETLQPLSSGTVVESDILLWQSYYWFIAILLLLAAEWWLRKRAGLV